MEFEKSKDPVEIARKFGFLDHKDLGVYMKEREYFWHTSKRNYFKREDIKEQLERYYFKDNNIHGSANNILSNEFSKIEVDDYYSIPLFLEKDTYKKLILYIRENNLDYNKVIETALEKYLP